jgi:transcriptional regulator with XRE-family HTH domain
MKVVLLLFSQQMYAKNRLELGLSQEALGEAAGVHRTYVGMLERAEKNVTIYNIERIAAALKVTPDSLLIDATITLPTVP